MTATLRALISAMQVTLDGYVLGPEGDTDSFESWADGRELLPPVDAFVLGGGMFRGYEHFWMAILEDPSAASDMLGRDPYPREVTYARVAAETPHLVLSKTLSDTRWPTARIVRDIEEIRALRQQPGKAVYVVGGPGLVTSLVNAGLLSELRLIVHPVAAGSGQALFGGIVERQALELVSAEPMGSGRVNLAYRLRVPGAKGGPKSITRSTVGGTNDFNNQIIAEFRVNGGRVSGPLAGTPLILIHHVGAKSGIERVTPLARIPQRDDRYVVVASNGGSPTHPSWYYNLKANPKVKVEVGSQTFTVLAEELDEAARAELWPDLVAASPSLAEFETKTTRQIPLFGLTRQDRREQGPLRAE
jgi:deazaflavin-dependent oxidoreductase (nitroreductase family)